MAGRTKTIMVTNPGSGWISAAKAVALPVQLSTTACGDRVDKWLARLAILRVQRTNLDAVLTYGFPVKGAGRAWPGSEQAIRMELGRIEARISEGIEAIGSIEPSYARCQASAAADLGLGEGGCE